LVFLELVGVVSPQTLIKQWRYATVIIFVLAAIITPSGDPYSMMARAIPWVLFSAISVVIGLMAQRQKRRAEAAAD
ncbi:MAG: twin-arginine translocase subunit TatC, partial [Ilumatobacteraceae bacterium]